MLPARIIGAVTNSEGFMKMPFSSDSIPVGDVMWHYTTQVAFCRTLNQVPTSLYGPENRIWAISEASSAYEHLLSLRKLIESFKPDYVWIDGDSPSSDLRVARMRAKYYEAGYIIMRPYLFHAVQCVDFSVPFDLTTWLHEYNPAILLPALPATIGTDGLPNKLHDRNVTIADVQKDTPLARTFLWCCMKCIEYAMYSTVAFDGVAPPAQGSRLRVTNIDGTATA
jgi:hypothetical protein